jgi:V8-like Glu-specific endopeptidase
MEGGRVSAEGVPVRALLTARDTTMKKTNRIALGLVAAALVAGAGAAAGGGAIATTQDRASQTWRGVVASADVPAVQARTASTYWTKQRMADAKPLVVRPSKAEHRAAGTAAPAPRGSQVSVPPVSGKLTGTTGPVARAAAGLARPYTNLPDRLNVKVFFTKATGGNFVCSGTVVNSATKRMVTTAGHCVSDGAGRFHRNVVVVPAYSSLFSGSGDAPYGQWTARTLTTTNSWHNTGNFKQDVGIIITNDRNGQRIVNLLGGQGTRFNASRNQFFRSYGYPQAAPFNGFNQYVCPSARLADDNPNFFAPGPLTMRISCNMTGGSSGGGWLVGESGGLGYVNSVNSYKYNNDANSMYGPYFGTEALNLFNFAVGLG